MAIVGLKFETNSFLNLPVYDEGITMRCLSISLPDKTSLFQLRIYVNSSMNQTSDSSWILAPTQYIGKKD